MRTETWKEEAKREEREREGEKRRGKRRCCRNLSRVFAGKKFTSKEPWHICLLSRVRPAREIDRGHCRSGVAKRRGGGREKEARGEREAQRKKENFQAVLWGAFMNVYHVRWCTREVTIRSINRRCNWLFASSMARIINLSRGQVG